MDVTREDCETVVDNYSKEELVDTLLHLHRILDRMEGFITSDDCVEEAYNYYCKEDAQ